MRFWYTRACRSAYGAGCPDGNLVRLGLMTVPFIDGGVRGVRFSPPATGAGAAVRYGHGREDIGTIDTAHALP